MDFIKEPRKKDWILAGALLLAGLTLAVLPIPNRGRGVAALSLMMLGGIMLCTCASWKSKFDKMSPEERRDMELMDQDERNLMLQDRTAWLCWNGENYFYVAAMLIFLFRDEYRVSNLITLIFWVRMLVFNYTHRWQIKKH